MSVKTISKLPAMSAGYRPRVILVGNGLNMLGNGKKWEKMINDMLQAHDSPYSYEEIKHMPASMQAVVATDDHVNTEMGEIANSLLSERNTESQNECIRRLLKLPSDAILTTNYSFEIEQAAGLTPSRYEYIRHKRSTKELSEKEKQFSLYRFLSVDEDSACSRIWHVHGDACLKSGMIMGTYYYGKLLGEIQKYIPHFMKAYKYSERNGLEYSPQSWVDYFLLGDVYILGLKMYLCEEDLWQLICCKKRNFPNSSVTYYPGKEIDGDIEKMLKAYGVRIDHHVQFEGNDYLMYYNDVITDIGKQILCSIAWK